MLERTGFVRSLQVVAAGLLLVVADRAGAAAAKCEHPVAVYQGGKAAGSVCPDEQAKRGLTVIDLGDGWTPYALGGAATAMGQSAPAYHDTFVELAAGKFAPDSITAQDGALEFYGIQPNLKGVLARMDDEARHHCHDAVADDPLGEVGVLRWERRAAGEARRTALTRMRARTDAAMRRRDIASRDELAGVGAAQARQVAELQHAEARAAAVDAMQAHLVCEGLMPAESRSRGLFDWSTSEALRAYQRRHWIVASGELDGETRDAMRGDPRELELRLALRALRQRVADAAGLIEDGSARAEWGTMLGMQLDGPEMRYQGDWPALADGAPDLISPATEAAAAALGWKDFASVRASLQRHVQAEDRRVAIKLPPAPEYHRAGTELRAVIDRGEVSYDVPKGARASRAGQAPTRRPVLIVYAKDGDRETALVRWPTTIGGWQDEKLANGAITRKYKDSDIGRRLWRDLVVAPVWFPPKSTPDADLVRTRAGAWELKDDLIGPGYRSAYGLAMLIHHIPVERKDGVRLVDRAIRTHGSVNYQSIVRGDSHGCHRIYNHQILRLTAFLLRHHEYAVKGPVQDRYVRKVRHKRHRFVAQRTDRGFVYELTPPVPIEVLAGTVVGRRQAPVKRALYRRR